MKEFLDKVWEEYIKKEEQKQKENIKGLRR